MNSISVIEHKDHLHKFFVKIQDYGFKIKETKCDFFHGKNQIPSVKPSDLPWDSLEKKVFC